MRLLLILFPMFASVSAWCQSFHHLDSIQPPASFENVHSQSIYSDSAVSSFLIFIKKEVKLHKHAAHTEHVYVLEGEGTMVLGTATRKVQPGDMILIPKGTPHSVKVSSQRPLKVVSVQAPFFDGRDRILLPE